MYGSVGDDVDPGMRTRDIGIVLVSIVGAALVGWGVGSKALVDPIDVPSLPIAPAADSETGSADFLEIEGISCYGRDGTCQLTKVLDVRLKVAPVAWEKAHAGQLPKVALVIGGIVFEHITARAVQSNTKVLRFRLDPNQDAAKWKELFTGQKEQVSMPFALALPEPSTDSKKVADFRLISNARVAELVVRPNELTRVIYSSIVVLILGLLYLGHKSDLLRDAGPALPLPGRKPYSLARTQLAVWTVVIVGSYLLLAAVLGSTNPFNETALILIGVSAATGLTATAIDDTVTTPKEPRASRGFIIDILSDEEGVTIYRFQMAVWTLVLAAVFFYKVWTELAMPDFNAVLLGLLGVSNGTYVGLKMRKS